MGTNRNGRASLHAKMGAEVAGAVLLALAVVAAGCGASPRDPSGTPGSWATEVPAPQGDGQTPIPKVVAAGGSHTVEVKSDGSLWGWGANGSGQLGDGGVTDHLSPELIGSGFATAVPESLHAAAGALHPIAAGYLHTLAVKENGTLWAWGDNTYGQLGLSTSSGGHYSPEQVGEDTDWAAVAAGTNFSLALKTNGSLWAWGDNTYGQLGIGTSASWDRPQQIGTSRDWVSIVAGGANAFGLKTDGSLWAWGDNGSGQLGIGTMDVLRHDAPTQVGSTPAAGSAGWRMLASGGSFTVGVKTDGTLWAWGENSYGQLGKGTVGGALVVAPLKVSDATDWYEVAARGPFVLATRVNLNASALAVTLWAWGNNQMGQLGLGTPFGSHPSPQQVGSSTKWYAIAAGGSHSLAVNGDAELWAWGLNGNGQLGIGSTTSSSSPVKVVAGP